MGEPLIMIELFGALIAEKRLCPRPRLDLDMQ